MFTLPPPVTYQGQETCLFARQQIRQRLMPRLLYLKTEETFLSSNLSVWISFLNYVSFMTSLVLLAYLYSSMVCFKQLVVVN